MTYRLLQEGEIIKPGDEVDACRDGYRDPAAWEPVTNLIGKPASNPLFPAHTKIRRKIQLIAVEKFFVKIVSKELALCSDRQADVFCSWKADGQDFYAYAKEVANAMRQM